MLNEFGPYANALDPNVAKTDQARNLIHGDRYLNNGVPPTRPMPSTDIPRANLAVPSSAWNYNSYFGNFYNYYSNQPYDLGEVPQQYASQKCGPQFSRNYGHGQPLPSTSVLQCCDPRCQLLSEHSKYPFNQTYCPKSSAPRQKHTKSYHNSVLNLPKPEAKPPEHAAKYPSCISYPVNSNDLSNKYANQQPTYSSQYQNSIKPPGPVITPESASFGEFYTDIGKPAYWNKAVWNRNIPGSYYSSADPNKDIHQKLSTPLLEQNGFISSNRPGRGILFNRLLESGSRQYEDNNAHTANYHSSNSNQLKHDFRPNYFDREYMLTENVHSNTRLSIPNNGYQPQPVYNTHYLIEKSIPPTNHKNSPKVIESRSIHNIDRPPEKNSSLDVREFLSTWDDEEDDKPTENASTEPPVIVLDCSSVSDGVEPKSRVKSVDSNNVVHNSEFESHSRIPEGKAAENTNGESTLSPRTSVIQDCNNTIIKPISEHEVRSHNEKTALESSRMNSEGWYSNSKKKHDAHYNLLEMTQRFVSSVFEEPEKRTSSDSKSSTLTSTSEHNPQNGKCDPMKEFVGNEWNMSSSNVKKKNTDTSLNSIHYSATKEPEYTKPEGKENVLSNKAYAQLAYGYNSGKEQSNHKKEILYDFHHQRKSNNLELSMNYTKQASAMDDYHVPKVQDYLSRYKSSVYEPHNSYRPAENSNCSKNYENFNHYYYSNLSTYNYEANSSNHIPTCREESINYVNSIDKSIDNDSAITLVKADLEKSLKEITNQFEQQPVPDINNLEHSKNNESYISQTKFTRASSDSIDKDIIETSKKPLVESEVPTYTRDEKDEETVSVYNSVIQKTGCCGLMDDICENSLLSMPSLSPPASPKNIDSSVERVQKPIDSSNLTLNDVYENDIIFDTEDLSIPKSTHEGSFIAEPMESDNVEPHQPLNLALSKNTPKLNGIHTSVLKIHKTAGIEVQNLQVMNRELASENPQNSKMSKVNNGYYHFDKESASQSNHLSPAAEKMSQPSDTNKINNEVIHEPVHTVYKTCIVSHKMYDEHTEEQKDTYNFENGTSSCKSNSNIELLSSISETNNAIAENGGHEAETILNVEKMSLVDTSKDSTKTNKDIDIFRSTSIINDLKMPQQADINEYNSLSDDNQTPYVLSEKLSSHQDTSETDFSHFFTNRNISRSDFKQNSDSHVESYKEFHHNIYTPAPIKSNIKSAVEDITKESEIPELPNKNNKEEIVAKEVYNYTNVEETQLRDINESNNKGIELEEHHEDLPNCSSRIIDKLQNKDCNNIELQIEKNLEDYGINSSDQNICQELDEYAVESAIEKFQLGSSSPENKVQCDLPDFNSSNLGNKENYMQSEACTLNTAVPYNESCIVQKESDAKTEFSSGCKSHIFTCEINNSKHLNAINKLEDKEEICHNSDISAYSNPYKKTNVCNINYSNNNCFPITPKKRYKHLKQKKKKYKKFNEDLLTNTILSTDVTSTFDPYEPSINAKDESSPQCPKLIFTSPKNSQSYYQHQTESDKFVEVQNLNSKPFDCIKSDKRSFVYTETYISTKKMKQDINRRSNSPAETCRSNNYRNIEEQFSSSNNENNFVTSNDLQETNTPCILDFSHENSTDRSAVKKQKRKRKKDKFQFVEHGRKYKNLIQPWRNLSISPSSYQEKEVESVPNYHKLNTKLWFPNSQESNSDSCLGHLNTDKISVQGKSSPETQGSCNREENLNAIPSSTYTSYTGRCKSSVDYHSQLTQPKELENIDYKEDAPNSLKYISTTLHHSQHNCSETSPVKTNYKEECTNKYYSHPVDYGSAESIINSDCSDSESQEKNTGYYSPHEETDVKESTTIEDFFNIPSVAPTPHCDLGKEDNIEFDSPTRAAFSPSVHSENDSLEMPTPNLTFNAPTPHCDFPLEEDVLDENAIKCISVHSKAPSPNYDFDYNQEEVLSKAPSPCCILSDLTLDNVDDLEQVHINNYQPVAPLSPASSVAPSPQCDIINGVLLDDAIDISDQEEAYDHLPKHCNELISLQNNVPMLKSLALDALNLVDIQIDSLMSNRCNLLEVRVTSECTEITIHSEDQLPTNGLDSEGERSDFILSNKSQEDESIAPESDILKSVEEDEDELQCQCLIISSEESIICLRCSLNSSVIINECDQIECESSLLPTLESTSDNNIDEEDTQSIASSQFSNQCIEDLFIDQRLDISPRITSEYSELMFVDDSGSAMVESSNIGENSTLLRKEYVAISTNVQVKVQLPWQRIFDLSIEGSNTCGDSKQLELGPAQIEIRLPPQEIELQNIVNSQPRRSASVLKVKRLILQPAMNGMGKQNGYHTMKKTIMVNGVEKHKNSKVVVKPSTIAVKGILGVPKMVIKKTSYREYRSYFQPNGILQPTVRLNRSRSLDELALKFTQEKTDSFTVNLKDFNGNRTPDWRMKYDEHDELVVPSPVGESIASLQQSSQNQSKEMQYAWQDTCNDIQDTSVNETMLLPKAERHHCLLCHRSYSSEEMYHLHMKSKFHRHLELTQRKTIHAMYRRFTGHICPRLRPLSAKERKKMKWKPRNSHRNHFYHQKTPLQITLHKSPVPDPES